MTDDRFSITIDSLGARGDGIGELNSKPVYVPFALPGEQVTIRVREERKSGIYGELVEVDKPSAERQVPPCPHFAKCGGCDLQHLNDSRYARWVRDRALFALTQQGLSDVPVDEPVIASAASRRRVALKALKTAGGMILGFNQRGSHQIVDLESCAVMLPKFEALLEPLRAMLAKTLPAAKLATVHLTDTDSGIDMLVDAPDELTLDAREQLVTFAQTHDVAAIHWNINGFLDPVCVRREPTMIFAGVRVPFAPASFIQASQHCEKAMTEHVLRSCEGSGRVADLFCGLGTFSFPLAQSHQVLAVEGARDALSALEAGRNMGRQDGPPLKQIVTRHRDLFRRPLTPKELDGFDAVVIDPPRAGALAQMQQLSQSQVQRIVSISCNPNTFARDARILVDGGYTFERLTPIDQFLWSSHLEVIGVFSRS